MQQITDSPTKHHPHHQPTTGISFFARSQKTTRWSHSPTVYAMIKGSRMDNCDDVQAIFRECQATDADDSICRTAERYMVNCMKR